MEEEQKVNRKTTKEGAGIAQGKQELIREIAQGKQEGAEGGIGGIAVGEQEQERYSSR